MDTFDDYSAQLIGLGGSAVVLAVNENLVIKLFASGARPAKDFYRELEIYERLNRGGRSPYVVQCLGRWETGIVMERMEMTLQQRLRLGDVPLDLQNQWMLEVCEGLKFLHSKGVIQGDVGSQNILLDAEAHAKICDFAGSMIDGKDAWISYQVRNQHPKYMGKQPCVESDIFALGSVIFEIVTGRAPYEELSDSSVLCKFQDGDFPIDRADRPDVMRIVEGCWKGEYVQVSEVIEDLMESGDAVSS